MDKISKVLLFIDRAESNDRRVLEPTDYSIIVDDYRINSANTGNKLWLTAVESYLTRPDIDYDYYSEKMTADYIMDNYDYIVFPCANRFRADAKAIQDLQRWTSLFQKIKIPIYVLGIGVQAPGYDCLDGLIQAIGKEAKIFIETVLNTGGVFGVRGYFTYEFFSKLGFKEIDVIGCPSMYLRGRELIIKKKETNRDNFSPVIVTRPSYLRNPYYQRIFAENPRAIFIDQNAFTEILYSSDALNEREMEKNIRVISRFGYNLVMENKVHLFYDIIPWNRFLVDGKYTFSFGNRIHGNFMSILSGIPAMVHAVDSRTMELAEYFDIPIIKKFRTSLYDLYIDLDYNKFNASYAIKYDSFWNFMTKNGIVKNQPDNNILISNLKSLDYQNCEAIAKSNIEHYKLKHSLSHIILMRDLLYDQKRLILDSSYIQRINWKRHVKSLGV